MKAVYLFLAILGLTKATPVELLTKFDADSLREAFTKFNEDDLKETLHKLYVDQFRDSVTKLNVEQLKEYFLDSNNRNSGPIETVILQVLERVRDVLVNGTDSIPVLDPFTIGRIHIGENILPSQSYITINDLTVKDVSTFKVDELKFTAGLLRQRLNFNIVVPAVSVTTSSYDLSLNVLGGAIFGKGNMNLTIGKPRVRGNITVNIRITGEGLFLIIQQCRIQVSLASFEPVITGMFNDQTISDFVAAFLRNLVTEMLEFFEEDITNILSEVVRSVGNLILADLDLGSLLPRS